MPWRSSDAYCALLATSRGPWHAGTLERVVPYSEWRQRVRELGGESEAALAVPSPRTLTTCECDVVISTRTSCSGGERRRGVPGGASVPVQRRRGGRGLSVSCAGNTSLRVENITRVMQQPTVG